MPDGYTLEPAMGDPFEAGAASLSDVFAARQAQKSAFQQQQGVADAARAQIGDKLASTWPAKLAHGLVEGAKDFVTLPHDAYYGEVDMNSDEGLGRAINAASFMIGAPAGASIPRGAGGAVLGSGAIREAPIAQFRKDAEAIQQGLPDVAEGLTRLWRGNRQGEVGKATSFTNDLPGIALPFRKGYGGDLSYVDVPTSHLGTYENTVGTATGAEFNLPPELASRATAVPAAAPQGITVYHGSPHDFDKFDMSKIGTGEGAQAYGHGLYFAGNEGVARSYRDTLSQSSISHPVLGNNLPLDSIDNAIATAAEKAAPGLGPTKHATMGANVTEAIKNGDSFDDFRKFVAKSDWSDAEKRAWNAALDKGQEFTKTGSAGHMYEARIHADPEHFLDWDKPQNMQSQKVQDALDALGIKTDPKDKYWMNTAANQLAEKDGSWETAAGARNVTMKLREAGIPGIKYLDAGSRGAGEGSRNYVTFRDDIITILRKYGLAGLGIGTGAGISHFKMQPAQGDPFEKHSSLGSDEERSPRLQFPGLDVEPQLPNPADRMAPGGTAYPPPKPWKIRSVG